MRHRKMVSFPTSPILLLSISYNRKCTHMYFGGHSVVPLTARQRVAWNNQVQSQIDDD